MPNITSLNPAAWFIANSDLKLSPPCSLFEKISFKELMITDFNLPNGVKSSSSSLIYDFNLL